MTSPLRSVGFLDLSKPFPDDCLPFRAPLPLPLRILNTSSMGAQLVTSARNVTCRPFPLPLELPFPFPFRFAKRRIFLTGFPVQRLHFFWAVRTANQRRWVVSSAVSCGPSANSSGSCEYRSLEVSVSVPLSLCVLDGIHLLLLPT